MMIDHIKASISGLKSQKEMPQLSVSATFPRHAVKEDATQHQAAERPSMDAVRLAVNEMNEAIKPKMASIQFELDEDTGRTVVKMIDMDSNQVIRQFPSEEALAISKSLDHLQGLMLRVKA
jgi:flagellar protein FlaG